MKLLGFELPFGRKSSGVSIDQVLKRIEAVYQTASGVSVTPENAMESPTVAAIVTAISRRIATLPVNVYQKNVEGGRTSKEPMPNHAAAKLLNSPNSWQNRVTFWLDAASWLVRYNNFYSLKIQGATGPIHGLVPLHPGRTEPKLDPSTLTLTFETTQGGVSRSYESRRVMHARGAARDGIKGDSPVMDVREAIALEIAAERMGGGVFGNGAQPGIVMQYAQGSQGHKTDEERKAFVDEFDKAYGRRNRFRALLLPKGIEIGQAVGVENEKAQFLATRQYQRTVIAGAFGVPPHMVGDLSGGTFSNVEQQSLDFVVNVVLPYVRIFEAALEMALLTDADRRAGVIIRFNLEGALRGDFKTRQEGLKIQREMGVINPNEWREIEGLNPISEEDGGESYWVKGPSGQGPDNAPPADDGGEGEIDPAADPDESEEEATGDDD